MIEIIFSTLNSFDIGTLSTLPDKWVSQDHYGVLSIQKRTLTIHSTRTGESTVHTFEELCNDFDIMGGDEGCVIDIRSIGNAVFINSHIVVTDFESFETGMEKSRQWFAVFNGKIKVESYSHVPTVRETVELFLRKYAGSMYFVNSTDFVSLDYYRQGIIKRKTSMEIRIVSQAPKFNFEHVRIMSAKRNPIVLTNDRKSYIMTADKDDVLYLTNTDIDHPEFRLAIFNLTVID